MDGGLRAPPKVHASNRLASADRAFHDWYRFVLAFPPHLVRAYLHRFGLGDRRLLLDPFCGTGTTLVEGKLLGCRVAGFEPNPVANLAARVKTDWRIAPSALCNAADTGARRAGRTLGRSSRLRALPPETEALLLENSICPLPLHKALVLRDEIEGLHADVRDYARIALAKTLVDDASNLHFGPEVGVRGRRGDADVVGCWQRRMYAMAADLESVSIESRGREACIFLHDSRNVAQEIAPASVDAVFTSPPYPNEKDYTRTTRLESVVLGFINNKAELRALKQRLVRSNTRGVYKQDDDCRLVAKNVRINAICDEIERRRIELGKTSGFERLYARVTRLYFGGMVRHLASLRRVLRQGAYLGYVVGDQASYLQVMIRTGEILGELAEELGYRMESLDLFRERFATATRMQIREEVLVLRWP